MNWLLASRSSGLLRAGVVAKLTVPRSLCFRFLLISGWKVMRSGLVAFLVALSGKPHMLDPPSLSLDWGPSGSPV